MAEKRIRVLLADDHTMFRQGVREMLATDAGIEVIGEADDGHEAVDLAESHRPDVVLLDVEMPRMGAAEAMRKICTLSPPPRVVIVTMHDSPHVVREYVERGASGFLSKSASLGELLAAVHSAAESPPVRGGNAVLALPPDVLERVEEGSSGQPSARELEILLMAARGLTNRQIGMVLRIAEATVKRHLANLYAKLGVGSRSEATRKALSEGWITTRDVTQEDTHTQTQTLGTVEDARDGRA